MRELLPMVEAKQADDWNHTAAIITWNAKGQFGKKLNMQRMYSAVHPFANKTIRGKKRRLSKAESIARLNAMVGLNHAGNSLNNIDSSR